jgi:hypothetical protein
VGSAYRGALAAALARVERLKRENEVLRAGGTLPRARSRPIDWVVYGVGVVIVALCVAGVVWVFWAGGSPWRRGV